MKMKNTLKIDFEKKQIIMDRTFKKNDIVNIGWHIYLKDITAYAASPRDS